ncbi:MAG: hypothetical protein PHT88_04890 [Candidatus Moranbacteria bacterium]|nr:hypothetical protein [Candidatus Moranbacteria bacterium]
MNLINLLLVIVVIGFLLWVCNTLIPMEPRVQQILNAVVIVVLVLWLLGVFLGPLPNIHIGR